MAAPTRRADLVHERGSPWENGDNESFNGKPRDELLSGEILLHTERGTHPGRAMASPLQQNPTTQLAGPPAPQAINPLVMSALAKQQ